MEGASGSGQTSSGSFDYHKAITKKERSSRYIRTAFDYLAQVKGPAALDAFLKEVGIERNSSIFKHVYDDENWNSYELEVYLYEKLKDKFDDPYRAIWEFGIASGSGRLDQKDTLFAFKLKIAPLPVIMRKISEHTERVSLISLCRAEFLDEPGTLMKDAKVGRIIFKYSRLPEGFEHPSWTSVLAGFGVTYATIKYRKGMVYDQVITHWPNLPSDLPSINGKSYKFDKQTRNVIEKKTGKIVANANDGPFVIDGITWNNGDEAIARMEWKPESLLTTIAKLTIHRSQIRREDELRTLRSSIVEELTVQHQHQLAAYESELSEKARLIQEHLEKIRELKVQQDGDYFLTSLLTRPMIANRNTSELVQTQVFVEQKKKFEFRKWKSELGGDTCITDQVKLRDRQYTVFLNGDAMGKSMQGAGGAIVLGVIFHTYLNRTRFSSYQKQKSPELWLRDAALDIQNAFLSFDGSMFVSLVIGLVDELTGAMYFINAEHPWIVLYRDGKASFLGEDSLLRKLGTPGIDEEIQIRTFQLRPGDTMLLGSDGRDDLEIGRQGDARIINEDEQAFLRSVEDGAGNLDRIVELLRKRGEITDDLSLLRLGYREDQKARAPSPEYSTAIRSALALYRQDKFEDAIAALRELCSQYPERIEARGYLGRVQFKMKRFEDAAQNLSAYFDENQDDSGVQYLIATASKRYGNLDKAIDFGERLALREPEQLNNLINLADSHRLKGNPERSRSLVMRALAIDPNNPHALRLSELLSIPSG